MTQAELQVKLCSARFDERERADQVAHEIMDAFAALQRRVEWTTSKPDKPGHYWMREAFQPTNDHIDFIDRVVEVFWYGDKLYCSYGYIDRLNNEWAFIPPPHEARG